MLHQTCGVAALYFSNQSSESSIIVKLTFLLQNMKGEDTVTVILPPNSDHFHMI